MNRKSTYMSTLSILTLTVLSGTAFGQSRYEPTRNLLHIAERAEHMKLSLADAIKAGEKHTGGTAIGVRFTMDRQLFLTDANKQRASGEKAEQEKARNDARDGRETSKESDVKRSGSQPNRSMTGGSVDPDSSMFAIVTCVIGDTAVRDVVIDMTDGSVLGVQSAYSTERNAWDAQRMDARSEQPRFSLVRATELMNATARNATNQHVGDIDDLVLDPESNRIVYGVLRRGGFLGFNESRYAVPASMLAVPEDGRILLNISNDEFDGRYGFHEDKWPTEADPAWATRGNGTPEKSTRHTQILRATDLIGTNVQCSQGQKVGEIADLIVEPSSGQVIYAIVSSERGRIVVPMAAVEQMGDGRVMNMTHAEVLALPTLGGDNEPDWGDVAWNQQVHDLYNTEMMLTEVPS